jgi:hypothetical protein
VGGFSVVASPSEQRRTSDGQRIGPDESQQNGGLNPAQFGAAAAATAVVIGERPAPVGWAVHDQLTSPQGQRRQCRNRSDSYTCVKPAQRHPDMILHLNFVQINNERRTCGGHDHGVSDAQFITERPTEFKSSSRRYRRPVIT